jgi:hypothetical protein
MYSTYVCCQIEAYGTVESSKNIPVRLLRVCTAVCIDAHTMQSSIPKSPRTIRLYFSLPLSLNHYFIINTAVLLFTVLSPFLFIESSGI